MLYPPKCPGCRQDVQEHGEWCGVCFGKLAAYRRIPLGEHHLTAIDSCYTLYEYEGSLKRIIHDMKFRQAGQYGPQLSWLVSQGVRLTDFNGIQCVIPVPLHHGRLKERGFNQTELIFRPWAQLNGFVWLDGLARTRKTRPQWELTLPERQENIRGAFRVTSPEQIAGRNILVVDDIFTTGLTLEACARELKKAGAKQVHCLTLASNAR